MGGLRKRIPITFWTMTMGVFAIAGIPPLRRLLLQGRDSLPGLRLDQPARQAALARRPRHRRHDLLLHVPPLVQDLLRPGALRGARRPSRSRSRRSRSLRQPRRHGRRSPKTATRTASTNRPGSCCFRSWSSPSSRSSAAGSAFPSLLAATTRSSTSSIQSSAQVAAVEHQQCRRAMASNSASPYLGPRRAR